MAKCRKQRVAFPARFRNDQGQITWTHNPKIMEHVGDMMLVAGLLGLAKGEQMKKPKMKTIMQELYDILRGNFQLLTEYFSESPLLLAELKEAYSELCNEVVGV